MVADVLRGNIFGTDMARNIRTEILSKTTNQKLRLDSSIASNTEELISMKQQEEKGRPVSIYEFSQNLVDYSTTNKPLICLDMADGESRIFTGHKKDLEVKDGEVKSVNFVSFGKGMDPADIILFSHGGGDGTLGIHGRGGSMAYAYCVESGMRVQITSTSGGKAYTGEIKMVEIPTKAGIKRMTFEYENVARVWREDERITEIKILEPTQDFIQSLSKLPEVFLYANPKYSGAKLVPPDGDAISPVESIDVWEGRYGNVRVECLMGLSEGFNRENNPSNTLMIGGLKVESNMLQNFALPWAIYGGEHVDNYRNRVTRSKDSRSAEGAYTEAIETFLLNTSSEKILNKLLDLNDYWTENKNILFSENVPQEISMFSRRDTNLPMSEITKSKFIKVLKERFDGSMPVIAESRREFEELVKKFGDSKRVIRVADRGMSPLFKAVGCDFYDDIFQIQEKITAGTLDFRKISEENAVNFLAEMVGGKNLKVSKRDGNIVINLEDKALIEKINLECFTSLPENDSKLYKLLSTVCFLGGEKYKINIRSVKGDRVLTFNFDVGASNRLNEVSLSVVAHGITDTTKDFPDGLVLEMRSDHLGDAFEKKFFDAIAYKASRSNLIEEEINAMSEAQVREELIKIRKENVRKEKEQQQIEKTMGAFRNLVKGKVKLKDWLEVAPRSSENEIVESASVFGVRRLGEEPETIAQVETNAIGYPLADYYRRSTTDTFTFNKAGQVIGTSKEKWEALSGISSQPDEWQIATSISVGKNWVNIPIKRGMNDVTYLRENGLEVIFDKEKWTVKARRANSNDMETVKFYQRNCQDGLFEMKDPEKVNFQVQCNLNDIKEPLSFELKVIRDDKKLSLNDKNLMVTMLHKDSFVYDDDPMIEEEVMKGVETIGQFEANLVNKASGICNYSAARLSIMKRLCGLPTKIESGVVTSNRELKTNHTHSWLLSWDGYHWYEEESTSGVVAEGVGKRIDPVEIYKSRIEGLIDDGYDPKTAANMMFRLVKKEVMSLAGPKDADNFHEKNKKIKINPVVKRLARVAVILAAESLANKAQNVSEEQKHKLVDEN